MIFTNTRLDWTLFSFHLREPQGSKKLFRVPLGASSSQFFVCPAQVLVCSFNDLVGGQLV